MGLRFAEGPSARRAQSGPRIGPETTTELAPTAGEDRRQAGQAHAVLLVAAGRESLDAAALWSDAGQDRGAAIASGLGEPPPGPDFKRRAGRREGKVSEARVKGGPVPGPVEAPSTANPTDNCVQRRSGVSYLPYGNSIMEIPAKGSHVLRSGKQSG